MTAPLDPVEPDAAELDPVELDAVELVAALGAAEPDSVCRCAAAVAELVAPAPAVELADVPLGAATVADDPELAGVTVTSVVV